MDNARIDFQRFGSKVPDDLDNMKYIETMTKALEAWKDMNDQRGFIIIACGENESVAPPKGLDKSKIKGSCAAAFAFGGNRMNLAALLGLLLRENKDFQKFVSVGIKNFTAGKN